MSNETNWIDFWKNSAECSNEAIRIGEIITENEEIKCDKIFKNVLMRYMQFLKIMDIEMQKQTLQIKTVLFRNIHIDIYSDLKIGDVLYHPTFISCFKDNFNNYFGDIKIKVIAYKDTPYLEYDNIIILPSGDYKLVEKNENYYTIELIGSFRLFHHPLIL